MDHLKGLFKEISFTDQDEVFDTLQREGVSSSLVISLRLNTGARAAKLI